MLGYHRDPMTWLQGSILLVILVFYVHKVCCSILSLEVIDLLQRQGFKAHVDLSLLSTWEQHTQTLCGVLIFLLAVRCVCLFGVNRSTAASLALLRLTSSRLLWPVLSGGVLLLALCMMGNTLVLRGHWGVSTLSPQPHQRHISRGAPASFYHGVLRLTLTVAWAALVIGVVSSLLGATKRAVRRRSLLTLSDMVGYIRDWAAVRIGRRKLRKTDVYTNSKTFYLQEFESLVDELLFRLNLLSNSGQHPLPPKDVRHREDIPLLSPTQSPSSLSSQSGVSETTRVTEETILNDRPDIGNLPRTSRKHSPDTHYNRLDLDLETLHGHHQRGQGRHTPAQARARLGGVGTSSRPLCREAPERTPKTPPSETLSFPSDRNLQSSSSLGGPWIFSFPDLECSASTGKGKNSPQIQRLPGWIDNQLVQTVSSHWTTVVQSGGEIYKRPSHNHRAGLEMLDPGQKHAAEEMEGRRRSHKTVVEVMVHRIPETETEEIIGTVRQS
ncbi:hypothetical protein DPEC_G00079010 [Dallia pectoralis]|uniref:Uncharacterized protein n=1 Tax=Dallia pectoralis TaxID=75939 RepID=A0ACC2H4B7_DALPE|nr:hypothetical protein DPEC_G00079010 [Dallia pectoralis]